MIELDLSQATDNGYKNFKPGMNKCWVTNVVKKTSTNGNAMLVVMFRDAEGATLKDHLVLTPAAMWRVKQFLKACQLPHSGKVTINESDIEHRRLILNCYAEAYKKDDGTEGTSMKVKEFLQDPNFSVAPKEVVETKKEEDTAPF